MKAKCTVDVLLQHALWHEIYRIILSHQNRKYSRNHNMFNIAADLAINKNMIPQQRLPSKFLPAKLSAEEYYKLILDDQNLQK